MVNQVHSRPRAHVRACRAICLRAFSPLRIRHPTPARFTAQFFICGGRGAARASGVTIQIARPMGNDPGTVEQACYFIDKGNVVACVSDGTVIMREARARRRGEPAPLTRWERKLRPGEDHLRAAKELLLQKYNAGKKGSDFNRPLRYPPSGVV